MTRPLAGRPDPGRATNTSAPLTTPAPLPEGIEQALANLRLGHPDSAYYWTALRDARLAISAALQQAEQRGIERAADLCDAFVAPTCTSAFWARTYRPQRWTNGEPLSTEARDAADDASAVLGARIRALRPTPTPEVS